MFLRSQNLGSPDRIRYAVRVSSTVILLAMVACAQKSAANQQGATPQRPTQAPSVAIVQTGGSPVVVDTDMFDAQKYVEQTGADASSEKTKRAAHEEALTREFFAGFNDAKDCDGIIIKGKGDQQPQFNLQLIVDSHDTPGQKPVWIWILSNAAKNKFIVKGEEDSGALAAKSICLAIRKATSPSETTTAGK